MNGVVLRGTESKGGELLVLPVPVSVQVVDISVAGVLLQSSRPVGVGTRGSLRLNIGGAPFLADVDVGASRRDPPETTSRIELAQSSCRSVPNIGR